MVPMQVLMGLHRLGVSTGFHYLCGANHKNNESMNLFVEINDPVGNYFLNVNKIIAVSEDVEEKYGTIVIVDGLKEPIQLRTPYEEIVKLFTA